MKRIIILIILLTGLTSSGFSQKAGKSWEKTRILFIFDASKSMMAVWEGNTSKFMTAKNIFNHIVDSLSQLNDLELALRVFGHQSPVPPQDCTDSKLEVPFGSRNASLIRQKIKLIEARGTTPIAYSLLQSANDFPPCENCRNVIVLITDGIEACDEDPCEAAKELQRKGIVVKPFVIGLRLDDVSKEIFNCVGDFYEAETTSQFSSAMRVIVSKAMNATTTQVNLFDTKGNPTETDVAISLFDREFNRPLAQYIHTINDKGVPDTLYLDDRITYRMLVHTVPPVEVDNIKIIAGTHNIITANAGRGKLNITQPSGFQSQSFNCVIRKAGGAETLSVQKNGEQKSYLVGKYDVEILSLPRIRLTNVEIAQSHTTTVEIPRAGLVRFIMRNLVQASVFIQKEDGTEWVCDLNPNLTTEVLTLMPGYYRVVYRPKYSRKINSTTGRGFEVVSGRTIQVEL